MSPRRIRLPVFAAGAWAAAWSEASASPVTMTAADNAMVSVLRIAISYSTIVSWDASNGPYLPVRPYVNEQISPRESLLDYGKPGPENAIIGGFGPIRGRRGGPRPPRPAALRTCGGGRPG